MNGKIKIFKRFLFMQKTPIKVMHRKIVFVKVKSSVIEISESVIDLDAVTLLVL